jgi:hypothetical protein
MEAAERALILEGLDLARLEADEYEIEEWTRLTRDFPPMALVLSGWIAQAKKKTK